jgi:hypothetical protein
VKWAVEVHAQQMKHADADAVGSSITAAVAAVVKHIAVLTAALLACSGLPARAAVAACCFGAHNGSKRSHAALDGAHWCEFESLAAQLAPRLRQARVNRVSKQLRVQGGGARQTWCLAQ